jgi:uncharacterized membrane protein (UPF0127 family)
MQYLRFFIGFFLIVTVTGCLKEEKTSMSKVCFQKKCYSVELALTPQEQHQGLMNRQSLPIDAGMLFVFPQNKRHAFWMKNTLISLDLIWLDYAKRVVHIERNVPPCIKTPCATYKSSKDALYVLELNALESKKWQIEVGSQLVFK